MKHFYMAYVRSINQYVTSHTLPITGIVCIIAGLVCNKFVIERLFSSDGTISALPVNIGIIVLQLMFISAGILYIRRAFRMLSVLGLTFLFLCVLQFWVRVLLEIPFPETRMFTALPKPPSLFEAGWEYHDQISRYEARFTEIKTMLPPTGMIGYVTSERLTPDEAKFHWGLTSYALSPLHVERTTSHPFAVGNFPDLQAGDALPTVEQFVLMKNFGNGVILFRKEETL